MKTRYGMLKLSRSDTTGVRSGDPRNVSRVCSVVTAAVLLSVPALRVLHPPSGEAFSAAFASPISATAVLGHKSGFTGEQIRRRADPVLARLAPGNQDVSLTVALSARVGGETQRLWFVTARSANESGGSERKDEVQLRYDADTGELIYAETNRGPGERFGASRTELTATGAIEAARAWTAQLNLAGGGEPTILCPPCPVPGASWRVWLRGREKPEGEALTVQVTINAVTGDLRHAAVAERVGFPQFYLPGASPAPFTGSVTQK